MHRYRALPESLLFLVHNSSLLKSFWSQVYHPICLLYLPRFACFWFASWLFDSIFSLFHMSQMGGRQKGKLYLEQTTTPVDNNLSQQCHMVENIVKCYLVIFKNHMYWNNFLGSRWNCFCLGAMWANWNLNIFLVLTNALPEQKSSISNGPIPECQVSSWPSYPKQGWQCGPASQIFSIFLFLILDFLSYKSFLPSILFCSSPTRDSLSHKVLNNVYFYHLNFPL